MSAEQPHFPKPEAGSQGDQESLKAKENERALEQARAIAQEFQQLDLKISNATDPEKKERYRSAREKCARIGRRLLRTITGVGTLLAVAGVIDYHATRYEVAERENPSGEIVYEHVDPETTHVLNVLAGKEEYSESERLQAQRLDVADWLRTLNKEVPKEIGSYSMSQLDSLDAALGDEDPGTVLKRRNALDSTIAAQEKYMHAQDTRKIYDALWELERECGNPKIRFIENNLDPRRGGFERSHYNPATNTCYITSPEGDVGGLSEAMRKLFAEISHAKQFDEQPAKYAFTGVTAGEGYDKEGSFEHEAHQVIQKKLQETYKLLDDAYGHASSESEPESGE